MPIASKAEKVRVGRKAIILISSNSKIIVVGIVFSLECTIMEKGRNSKYF